ncbi:T3SS regulon anti-activator ExsD domain-containing protein [Shewanella psychrophila]|nr:T3SS regulon anti-activator ExsD domain-containing protein [Shewanella psychrophila]
MNKSKFKGRKISLVTGDTSGSRTNLSLASSVVNVSHKNLVEIGVVSEQQLLLLKRVIERRILDCILASDYINACVVFGISLTKSDLKIFLKISADIFRHSQKYQMHELLSEVNAGLTPKFNLGHIEMLAKLVHQSFESWLLKKNDNHDEGLLGEYQALVILKSQLETKVKFWRGLVVNDVNKAYLEAHVSEACNGLEQCELKLSRLEPSVQALKVYRKQVVDTLLFNLNELILHGVSSQSFSSCLASISSDLPELTGVLNMINDLALGHETDHTSLGHWLINANSMPSNTLFEVERAKSYLISPLWKQVSQ